MALVKVTTKTLPTHGVVDFHDEEGNVYEVSMSWLKDAGKRSADGGVYHGVWKHTRKGNELCSVTRNFLIRCCKMRVDSFQFI
jgi:hypothetical protein